MSLNITDFTHLVIVRSGQMTSNALADHRQREADHRRIELETAAFLKAGGKIGVCQPSVNASTATYATDIDPKDRAYIESSLTDLKASFGNNMSISICRETGQYKAFYKGEKVGTTHKSASKAVTALRRFALKYVSNAKRLQKNERKQISENKE